MTTINDIARMAKVSRTTVSRVLNNNGYASDQVRKRIMEVVEETGYMPSQSAKSLRTKKTGIIGVVLPKIGTETSSRVVAGINEVLSKRGFQILLTDTELDANKEIDYLRLLESRQVDGIVLLATNVRSTLIEAINNLSLPVVAIGQEIPGVDSITYDNYQAGEEVMQLLIDRGHQRIGFIGVHEEDPSVGGQRKQAYIDKLNTNSLLVEENWIEVGDFSIDSGYYAMRNILNMKHAERPTALFCVNDRMAVGAMEYLKEHNFRVPDDMAVVGMGASELSRYVCPPLTTVDYHNEKVSSIAAEMLLAKVENSFFEKKSAPSYRLILRDSV